MSPLRLIAAAIAAAAALAAPATAAAIPAGSTTLIDRPSGFGSLPFDGVNESQITQHAVSADGRYVVFSSASDSLLDSDDDAGFNVYRLDRQGGKIEQVNTSADGTPQGPSESASASISADGRYVAFTSFGTGLIPDQPLVGVYVKDMVTGKIELASRADGADGAAAPITGGFTIGTISGDGRHVAFTAGGVLHAENADGKADQNNAYVRDLDAGTTHLVSVKSDGSAGGGVDGDDAPVPDFNGDGVAFITGAQLDPADVDDGDDAYMRLDIGKATEETCFVSFSAHQTPGADSAETVDLAGDGSDVAWADHDGVFFSQESQQAVGAGIRVDVAPPGGSNSDDGDRPSFEPVTEVGAQPKRLYFRTGSALDPGDDNESDDVYDAELAFIGNATHVHRDTFTPDGTSIDDVSGTKEGALVIFDSAGPGLPGASPEVDQVYQHVGGVDRNISQPPGRAPRADDAGSAFLESTHAVSDDGRQVVFSTEAAALGVDDERTEGEEVAMRDVVTGKTTLISAQPDGSPASGGANTGTIDAAGEHVAFVSRSDDLLPTGNPNGGTHAYVRNLQTGETKLVDRRANGTALVSGVDDARIAPDGKHLVYVSRDATAPGSPADNKDHVYVVDLTNGDTKLVDRAADGTIANGTSNRGVDVNADASVVAFTSTATNLGVAGSDDHPQLYVRDTNADTVEWASAPEDGDPTHATVSEPSLSRDGRRVAFTQFDPGFGHGMTGDSSQIFLRDVQARTTQLVSGLPGGEPSSATGPSLSADGRRVAFGASSGDELAANLKGPGLASHDAFAPGAKAPAQVATAGSDPAVAVWLRDVDAPAATLVSVRADGSAGGDSDFDGNPSIDGTGACVAFRSETTTPLTDPSYGPDFEHVYLRAVDDDCPGTAAHPEPSGGNPPPGGDTAPPVTGGGPAPADKTAPRISAAKLTARTFAVGKSSTVVSARAVVGTTFTFSLSEPAATTIAISRRTTGRRKGTRCVAPRRGLTKRCTRVVGVVTLKRAKTLKGTNRVAFSGKVGRTALKPGSYQAIITARDKAGNVSKPVKLTFKVVKR